MITTTTINRNSHKLEEIGERAKPAPRLPIVQFLLLILLPLSLCAYFVHSFAIDVPIWDEWKFFQLADTVQNNPFSSQVFNLQKHRDHILLVPQLLMFCVGSFTKFNIISWIWTSIAFLMAINIAILSLARSYFFSEKPNYIFYLLPIPWIICSLRQWDNFLMGYQLCMFCLCFFFVATAICLRNVQSINKKFLLAVGSASLCMLSFGAGVLVWPLGALQLYLQGRDRLETSKPLFWKVDRVLIAWLAISAISLIVFAVNYESSFKFQRTQFIVANDWTAMPTYFLATLGIPLGCEITTQVGFGIIYLVLLSATVWTIRKTDRSQFSKQAALFLLVLFGLCYSIMLTIGRLKCGMNSACLSRYATVPLFAYSGLYIIIISNYLRSPKNFGFQQGALIALTFLMVTLGNQYGLASGPIVKAERLELKQITKTYRFQTDETLHKLYPLTDELKKDMLPVVEKNHWSCFAEKDVSLAGLYPLESKFVQRDHRHYNVEALNESPIAGKSQIRIKAIGQDVLKWRGWAIDPTEKKLASLVLLKIDDNLIPCAYEQSRPDVGKFFNDNSLSGCGFTATVQVPSLGKGNHKIALVIIAADRKHYYLESNLPSIYID